MTSTQIIMFLLTCIQTFEPWLTGDPFSSEFVCQLLLLARPVNFLCKALHPDIVAMRGRRVSDVSHDQRSTTVLLRAWTDVLSGLPLKICKT